MDIDQATADMLIAMEKHRVDDKRRSFPVPGSSISMQLRSADSKENFILDVWRGRIAVSKVNIQNRARHCIPLVRLDVGGPPHTNPDGVEMPCPHVHLYREGFGDRWAFPLPEGKFHRTHDMLCTLDDFMDYCNITIKPHVEAVLF